MTEPSQLICVEDGSVDLMDFCWPPADADAGPSRECLSYALMRRPGGFLLCLPVGYLDEDVLRAGGAASPEAVVGPSVALEVPPVALTEDGEWVRAEDQTAVPALIVDLSDAALEGLSQTDLLLSESQPFSADRPGVFPLASEALKQAKAWVEAGLQGVRSGYQTAASEPPAGKARAPAKVRRPTVAQLAQQQDLLAKTVEGIASQLATLVAQGQAAPAAAAPAQPAAAPLLRPRSALQAPVSGNLSTNAGPKTDLTSLLGPPPRTRQARPTPTLDNDPGEEPLSGGPLEGGLPVAEPDGGTLAEAMLLQSKAISALVSQMAMGTDPLAVDLSTSVTSLSTRGTSARQKLQAELLKREGGFARRMRQSALLRMAPTSQDDPGPNLMSTYLERFGGYGSQKLLGLLQYQLAQASDLLASGSDQGAADIIAQAMIMVDQVCVDSGRTDLGFLFSLQPDPPTAVFVNHGSMPTAGLRPFSHLADSRLVASTLAYVKELETLSARRLELGAPPKKPGGPPPLPPGPKDPPHAGEPALSKKQQRAKAWAAKRSGDAA